ncbi:peptidase family M48 [Rubidibacter lacunae KORDI 51-2]|uniref:Peptidase family M48 n=1 Tax=Rubidibacter lacunae KORDI 51-2 TaxID=582515 RepID=U5DRJ3_9CHRO|nr:M48 family metallopeptidase [Rubidibacter lacunae]ERN42315.1 peptidase family M48 [Rubidibacter lacunae KORDI 51-2]
MIGTQTARKQTQHRWTGPLLAASIALGSLAAVPQPSQAGIFDNVIRGLVNGGVQAIQMSSLSDEQEIALGRQIDQQVRSQVRLSRDRRLVNYVNRIGQRLVPYSERPDIPYSFRVVEDPAINAFATMGGFIYVNTGLIAAAQNEAELASVVAHEIAHVADRHAVKQMREAAIASGVATTAGVNTNQLVGIGVELALRRPHSRRHEYEADKMGLVNLARAGYAPEAMVSFMQTLLATQGNGGPAFLSTHPLTRDRVARLAAAVGSTPSGGDGLDRNAHRRQIASLL